MIDTINEIIANLGTWGPLVGCLLIIVESMLPVLPLCVFIVINFLAFGSVLGLIISWIFTILGCMLSFTLCRKLFKKSFDKKFGEQKQIKSIMKLINNATSQQIVILLAIPFTPAFAINIAAGLSKISYKKYLIILLISKIFMVYFWGYVGLSLVDCLTNPMAIVKIVIMVLLAYVISKIVTKKFNIE